MGSPALIQRLEAVVSSPRPDYERALLADLPELLALPGLDAAGGTQDTDVVLDVALQGCRAGSATEVSLGVIGLPLWWRPQVSLVATLYRRVDGQNIRELQVTEVMLWQRYVLRVLSWRVLMGQESLARRSDLDLLLRRAVQAVLHQLPARLS